MTLNIAPGLGSFLIMDDYLGAGIQIYLTAIGIAAFAVYDDSWEYSSYCPETGLSSGGCSNWQHTEYNEHPALLYIGLSVLGINVAFNILRSALYNEPAKSASHATSNQHSGFNLSVLPSRKGEVMPYVMYNRSF